LYNNNFNTPNYKEELKMAELTTETYLDMEGLSLYDSLIKAKMTQDISDSAYDDSELSGKIGSLEKLNTTTKSNLVSAINEVRAAVSTGGTEAQVTIDTTTTTTGAAKSYTFKQGNTTIGVVDIPKDMVVSSGQVVTNPVGEASGTYLELTLANATADKIYINVGTLVDIYTAKASATQIQLAINSTTREISATIVDGSVSTAKLANSAVTTIKLANGNVTKEKLATDVQNSLDKADSAIQSIVTGKTNGTVSIDGTDVPVKGLGSAAYTASSAYESAGAVKALADGQVATNKADIEALQSKVETLESVKYTAITAEEINSLFA